MSVLEARGLGVRYGSEPALSGVDLAVAPGEFLCILGPNGAGKSTLLKACAGLVSPSEGVVALDGRPVGALRARERARRIAVVLQDSRLPGGLTVAEAVARARYPWIGPFARSSPSDRERIEAALARTDVGRLAGRRLGELSGGERQRVRLARALAQDARWILLDEPAVALDPAHRIEIFGLLAELAAGGCGVLAVTHDLNLAGSFARRLLLLDRGRAIAQGPPETVLDPGNLERVYRCEFLVGRAPTPDGERPYVVPWRRKPHPEEVRTSDR